MELYYTVTASTTVPAPTALSGTNISTSGKKVIGNGTSFLSEVQRGAWIWNNANEFRKVIDVISNTELLLDSAFTADLSAVSGKQITKKNSKCIFMEVKNTGSAATTINGVAIATGATYTNGQINPLGDTRKFAKPIHVDGATSTCTVTLTMYGNTQ